MSKIEKSIIKEFNVTRNKPRFLSNVPLASTKISYLREVSLCCYNTTLTTISPELYIDTLPMAPQNSLRLFLEKLFLYL